MTFVEWLRVRNIARILAIVLGVCLLLTVVLRVSLNDKLNMDSKYQTMFGDAGDKITDSVLPDGTHRRTIVNPRQHETYTIDNHGYFGYHVVVTEPGSSVEKIPPMGSAKVVESTDGKTKTITIDTDEPTPFLYYMIFADMMAFIIATLLATPFARESDGHLEYAVTKPVSRATYALNVIGVDLAGIVLCTFMTVAAIIVGQAFFELPRFDLSGVNWQWTLLGFIFPFAWYAMVNAATASLSRGYGAIQGFVWPVAIAVLVLSVVPLGDSLLGQVVHNVTWVVGRISPLTYMEGIDLHPDSTGQIVLHGDFMPSLAIETLLFVVYSLLAVLQWRRVEA